VNGSTFLDMGQWRRGDRRIAVRRGAKTIQLPVDGWKRLLNTTSKSEVVPVFALVPLAVNVYLPLSALMLSSSFTPLKLSSSSVQTLISVGSCEAAYERG